MGDPVPRPLVDLDEVDQRILALAAAGHTNDGIARRLGLSERTVRRRLRAVADGLGVGSTIEAVVAGVRAGVI
ncbi:helix-turn-helix transcriptional regulator [Nocardioides marinus]|uniref:DNA-binding NarL/FixJ family response regulator n=1 Tax=Nocardioides marinus TaxID=374514 RepID=A0A7Z0C6J2_9ACTN|nr:DNA-binding NarL/FixJ family response regulator [Nocardioides marinus]